MRPIHQILTFDLTALHAPDGRTGHEAIGDTEKRLDKLRPVKKEIKPLKRSGNNKNKSLKLSSR